MSAGGLRVHAAATFTLTLAPELVAHDVEQLERLAADLFYGRPMPGVVSWELVHGGAAQELVGRYAHTGRIRLRATFDGGGRVPTQAQEAEYSRVLRDLGDQLLPHLETRAEVSRVVVMMTPPGPDAEDEA